MSACEKIDGAGFMGYEATRSFIRGGIAHLWGRSPPGPIAGYGPAAPKHLQELCVPVTSTASRRHTRSAARGDLQVLTTRTATFRPRSFVVTAPKLWNSLPLLFRRLTMTQHTEFGSRLKLTCFV